MPTIRDVALAAQVSTSTVSHVINQTRHVSPETRRRVLEAMATLNYRPNRLASSLRNQRTQIIGVLLPNSANPFFAEVLLGIEAACYDTDYNFIMGNANDDPERELRYLDVLLSRQVDGVLLISTGALDDALNLIAQRDVPVVLVDRTDASGTVDALTTANHEGGYQATRHLIQQGHERIACITGPAFLTTSAERVEGYRQALAEAKLSIDEKLIVNGDFSLGSGATAMQTLLQCEPRPTAVFACNDLMALGALHTLHEADYRVPQDVSLIGYDDIPLASYAIPSLTTIAQPGRAVGHRAVEMLVARIQQPHAPPRQERLPNALIERDSCAPIRHSTKQNF